jgi:hypothetical protein
MCLNNNTIFTIYLLIQASNYFWLFYFYRQLQNCFGAGGLVSSPFLYFSNHKFILANSMSRAKL